MTLDTHIGIPSNYAPAEFNQELRAYEQVAKL